MKFNYKKNNVIILGFGIILSLLYLPGLKIGDTISLNYPNDLPNSSTWVPNGVQVTNGVPLITYDDMAMCSDGAGGVIIAWSDDRYAYYHVYAQRVDSNGNVLWTTNGVAMWDPWEDQTNVQICSDGAGGAIVVWEDNRNHFYYDDIFAQRIDANGNKLWNIRGVPVVEATYYQTNPQLCSDGAGGAIITWDDYRGADEDIYTQRINSAGTAQWTANGINICTMSGHQRFPKICSDGAGGAIVAWTDERAGESQDDIYAQRVNSAGTVQWAANGIAICTLSSSQGIEDITSDGAGGAIIVWGGNVYAQRVNSAGTTLWPYNGVAVCTASGTQSYTKVINLATGGAIITWQDGRSSNYDIYAQKVGAGGVPQWTADGIPVCTALGNQIYPQICNDGAFGAIITWEDGRSGNKDVYAQRIGALGASQWTLNGTPVCSLANYQGRPQIVGDSSGHAIIAWEDTRTYSGRDIYAFYIINSIPTSTHPSDIITAFERPANIEWNLSDDFGGGQFRVVANDTNGDYYEVQGWTSWSDGTFVDISIDTSITGFFEFILEFYDSDNQYGANDTVLVNIMENTAPTSNHPNDILTIKYRTKTIDWVLSDEWDGGKYQIIANNTSGNFYVYKNWTLWSPDITLNILINTSIPGTYNYSIIYYDNQDKFGVQDTVLVSILDDLNPTCDHPADIATVLGDNQYLRWTLNDDYGGGLYRVIANNTSGDFYVWRAWVSWVIGEKTAVQINRTELGVFNYTIEYYDSYGQYGIPDTILVTVNQNNPPTCNHPDDITTSKEDTNSIQWILNDDYGGGTYRVIITTSTGASSTWIDWTSWDVNVPLNISIDRSRTGVFNYTIEYRDIYGVEGMEDTVKVTIPGDDTGTPFPLPLLFTIIGAVAVAAVVIAIIYVRKVRRNA